MFLHRITAIKSVQVCPFVMRLQVLNTRKADGCITMKHKTTLRFKVYAAAHSRTSTATASGLSGEQPYWQSMRMVDCTGKENQCGHCPHHKSSWSCSWMSLHLDWTPSQPMKSWLSSKCWWVLYVLPNDRCHALLSDILSAHDAI